LLQCGVCAALQACMQPGELVLLLLLLLALLLLSFLLDLACVLHPLLETFASLLLPQPLP